MTLGRYWFRARRFLALKVLHTDDPPHAIALGVAVGVFVGFLPLVGLQTVIAIAVAALLRANKIVCVPIVWITNPVTMWPIYYGCLKLGQVVTPWRTSTTEDVKRLVQIANEGSLFDPAFWGKLATFLGGVGVELWVGCIIVGLAFGIPAYFGSRSSVTSYRERRRQKLLKRSLFRAKAEEDRLAARHREPA